LLDADCQPLSNFMLARLLKWDIAELRKELRVLVAAGLIDRARTLTLAAVGRNSGTHPISSQKVLTVVLGSGYS